MPVMYARDITRAGAHGSPDRLSIMALAASNTAVSQVVDRAATIAQLAHEASIEISVHEIGHLEESRRLLPAGKALYVSHLPKQQWSETEAACRAVRAAGFRP